MGTPEGLTCHLDRLPLVVIPLAAAAAAAGVHQGTPEAAEEALARLAELQCAGTMTEASASSSLRTVAMTSSVISAQSRMAMHSRRVALLSSTKSTTIKRASTTLRT